MRSGRYERLTVLKMTEEVYRLRNSGQYFSLIQNHFVLLKY